MKLHEQHCVPNAPALDAQAVGQLLPQVPGWVAVGGCLERSFKLRDYHETIAFVNAMVWMIHREDHHPELRVGYNTCIVRYSTHSAGNAISQNDFICAARTSALFEQRAGA
jgi:4a-hydroxytetrahydrobiopterin dehydratase